MSYLDLNVINWKDERVKLYMSEKGMKENVHTEYIIR